MFSVDSRLPFEVSLVKSFLVVWLLSQVPAGLALVPGADTLVPACTGGTCVWSARLGANSTPVLCLVEPVSHVRKGPSDPHPERGGSAFVSLHSPPRPAPWAALSASALS